MHNVNGINWINHINGLDKYGEILVSAWNTDNSVGGWDINE